MLAREKELMEILWEGLGAIPNLHLMAGHLKQRLGVISFYVEGMHYNLGVKLLNDRFGIQVRGGCSCAGTYGHFLLHVDQNRSLSIHDAISQGDLLSKPGWIRLSIHPTMTDAEMHFICESVRTVAENFEEWEKDYEYCPLSNSFKFGDPQHAGDMLERVEAWFDKPLN